MRSPFDLRTILAGAFAALAMHACGTRARPAQVEEAPFVAATAAADVTVRAVADPSELEPGTIRAYGVLMPVGTMERLSTETSKVFYVQAPMPRVMRYLQRRMQITTAEIHPLGAMVRNARVITATGTDPITLDVGVRDEGDRTMVSLWNRSALPLAPRSNDEGMRAAGFDPRTGRPLPQNNY